MIALFTDFGVQGPYLGQMRAVLHAAAPSVTVVDLMSDAPRFDPRAGAYLLDAVRRALEPETVFLCVVDPGVGSGDREPVALRAHDCWFVGPGNGLLDRVAAGGAPRAWRLEEPPGAAPTFHGRDVFAPAAARIALGGEVPGVEVAELPGRRHLEPDLAEIVYIDGYGNAWTGIRADALEPGARLRCAGHDFAPGRTFADAAEGAGLWYANSSGLAEIALNRASAAALPGVRVGAQVEVVG